MKRLTGFGIVQVILCPLYFWLSFMVNARLTDPYPAWVVVLIASWVMLTVYGIAWLLYWWKAPNRTTRAGALGGGFIAFAVMTYLLSYVLLPGCGVYLFDPARPFYLDEFMLNMAQFYV